MVKAVIQMRRDPAATWITNNPVLAEGEKGLESDTGREKRGDGVTAWNSLGYNVPAEEGVVALVDAATIAVDATQGHKFAGQITDDRTLGFPTGLSVDGQLLLFEIQQADAGGKALTYDTGYVFPPGLPAPTLTPTAKYVDLTGFIYRKPVNQLWCIAIVQGFDGSLPM